VFDISLDSLNAQNIYFDFSGKTHSGTKYILNFTRKPGFFLISYLIPCMLVIFLTYSSFWLDKASVPARVSIGITPVLICASLIARANSNVPNISYTTWMSMFFSGILVFTSIGMINYGLVSCSLIFYLERRKNINANIDKLKKKTVSENKFLAEAREKAKKGEIHDLSKDSPKDDPKVSLGMKFSNVRAQTPGFRNENSGEEKKSSFDNHSAFEIMEEDEKDESESIDNTPHIRPVSAGQIQLEKKESKNTDEHEVPPKFDPTLNPIQQLSIAHHHPFNSNKNVISKL